MEWSASYQDGCREDRTKKSVRVNPVSGSAIRYPTWKLSVCVLSIDTFMTPTVGLAVDDGGFTADARITLDGDFVNVFIDASHACDCMMMDVWYGFHRMSASIYLKGMNHLHRVRILGHL